MNLFFFFAANRS